MDSDCIRFRPGDCGVTLWPRPGYVPNHYLPPSSTSRDADTQISVCPVRALRIYIDRSASFRQSDHFLCATVVVRRAGPYQNRGFPTGLWTLSQLIIQANVWNALFTLGPTQQGPIAASWAWSRGMSIQDIQVHLNKLECHEKVHFFL